MSRWHRRGAWALAMGAMLAVSVAGLVSGCTALGGKLDGARLDAATQSPQWQGTRFVDPQPLWADASGAWQDLLFGPATPDATPHVPVAVDANAAERLRSPPSSGLRLTWFGHSSMLLEIDGLRVLIDPLFSERASPVAWAGPKRWYAPPATLDDIAAAGPVDAVLISHDHYDHLDQGAIAGMAGWSTRFIVPLGVGAHLERWGVPATRIVELDWWQETALRGVRLVATPARHRSGRGLGGGNRTLWAGWAVVGPAHRAWYSGDTGFHDGLAEIGRRLGPFDLTMIEAGQYNPLWPDTHLGPEHAVLAHQQVRGRTMVPVHWGLIQEAPHPWIEPVERALAAAACAAVDVATPRPGQSIEPPFDTARERWWPAATWRSAAASPQRPTRRGDPADRLPAPACPPPSTSTSTM
ncbi:MBL fold metallo-hydrolase [Mitsuaria sp. GD03876]|uniref:MBL fold metallo-hydrolase n=1 Tax=Mitsuaria sp. GD03876 TaxID=2975399 RepID=UPI00244A34B8|nr:MBL fold metallo-hydrolase [Mitsuaria sp. GD03876]MDH0864454.1 MBL fold metallo-hydrolase [Mitsuaria sp. GD03876]